MKYIRRILAFLVCAAMMVVAAINCHKSILGHEIMKGGEESLLNDSIMSYNEEGLVVVNTTSLSDMKGFGGKIPLEIKIDGEGKVVSIDYILPNAETPDFLNRTRVLFDSWVGKPAAEAYSAKVDAISGATMSSNAIKANVEAGLAYYAENKGLLDDLKKDNADMGQEYPASNYKLWLALAITLLAAILPLFIKNRIYHIVQLILDVVVLGFWCGKFISYSVMVNYLSSGTGILIGLVPIVMMAVAFIYPIFGRKQHYCNHICPLGAIQQLAGYCCPKKIRMPVKTVKGLNTFRECLWAVLMCFLWMPILIEWMDYELFAAFIVESASWIILACTGLVVVLSFFIPRPYCNYICPTGTLMKMQERMFE